MQVIIMSGISGSGKSSYIQRELIPTSVGSILVSADDYFVDADGVYRFSASELGDAHGQCFREFVNACQSEVDNIFVDNTNTTVEEIAPYMLGAAAFGYTARIITISCPTLDDVKVACARCRHKVPIASCMQQHQRLLARKLPPWWSSTYINSIWS